MDPVIQASLGLADTLSQEALPVRRPDEERASMSAPAQPTPFNQRPRSCAYRPRWDRSLRLTQARLRSAVPAMHGVGGPTGGDAYVGVSSAMRPSLQPYLASKSAFTVAAS
jgi:hypothetical protein